ncbi:MAG: hypothetical protein V4534_07160 [Myxococcota bacterium]
MRNCFLLFFLCFLTFAGPSPATTTTEDVRGAASVATLLTISGGVGYAVASLAGLSKGATVAMVVGAASIPVAGMLATASMALLMFSRFK